MADGDDGELERNETRLDALLHDLRTPLSAMRTAAEMIGREPLSMTQRSALRILIEAADALIAMTGTMLGSGGDACAPSADVPHLLKSVADLFELEIRKKGLAFEQRVDPRLDGRKILEPLAVYRALGVLLDNGMKYTKDGTITLRAELAETSRPPSVQIDVTDTGSGVSLQDREALFMPHHRGAASVGIAGTGIGLWNARRLTEAAGGTLELAATSSQGSTFRIVMPLLPLDEVNSPAQFAAAGSSDARVAASAGLCNPTKREPIQRVLVIDDNATNRRLLGALVSAFGFEAELVGDGAAGVARAEAGDYAAILLDLHMPDMDGLVTLNALRALPQGTSLRVIAVTATAQPSARHLQAKGLDAVVMKPIDPEALHRTLENAIAK